MLTDGGADLPLAAAAARIAATEAYDFAAKENIQTHGGIGFTWEADTQFHYRRARVMALSLGGPMAWKDKLVQPSSNAATRPEAPRATEENHGLQRHPRRSRLPQRSARLARRQRHRKSDDKQSFRARNDDPELLKKAKDWQAKKAAAGYACITWPKEWGGRGGRRSCR